MAGRNTLYHNPNLTTDVKNWRWVGENVGYGPDALTVHVAFMQSAPHRANILDRDYTEVGIGAVVVNGRVWVAEVFRRPMRITTSSVTATVHAHTLRHGSTGAAVKRVQGRLSLRQTGYYGTYTAALSAGSRRPRAGPVAATSARRPGPGCSDRLTGGPDRADEGAAHDRRRRLREEGPAAGAVTLPGATRTRAVCGQVTLRAEVFPSPFRRRMMSS